MDLAATQLPYNSCLEVLLGYYTPGSHHLENVLVVKAIPVQILHLGLRNPDLGIDQGLKITHFPVFIQARLVAH